MNTKARQRRQIGAFNRMKEQLKSLHIAYKGYPVAEEHQRSRILQEMRNIQFKLRKSPDATVSFL